MLDFSLLLSGVLLLVTINAASRPQNRSWKYPIGWLLLLIGWCPVGWILPAVLVHGFLSGIVSLVWRATGAGPRSFMSASIGVFLFSYAVFAVPRIAELRDLRQQYPFESLDARLSYEDGHAGVSIPTVTREPRDDSLIANDIHSKLATKRAAALKDLHGWCVQLFASAPGFGAARVPGRLTPFDVTWWSRDLESAKPITIEGHYDAEDFKTLSTELPQAPVHREILVPEQATPVQKTTHRLCVEDFLNPIGNGYVRDRAHVAGFVSHRLTRLPLSPSPYAEKDVWHCGMLDLVSLLKQPEPVAYISDHLPRMDELGKAPTRPLDLFEAENLPKLQAGSELAVAEGLRRLRMLGAIRAQADCAKCHSVEVGELLGAFSYEFRRHR
jgi:hypothetical protein